MVVSRLLVSRPTGGRPYRVCDHLGRLISCGSGIRLLPAMPALEGPRTLQLRLADAELAHRRRALALRHARPADPVRVAGQALNLEPSGHEADLGVRRRAR